MINRKMSFLEAKTDIVESGIELGAGDYVDIEALKIAVIALDKQIPKKPVILEGNCGIFKGNKNYCCPTCSQPLYELESDGYYQVLYPTCECGQRIDWSEEC